MKTAALMPTPGDPFVVQYWLRNCARVWRSEVDELHVLCNGQQDGEAVDEIRRMVEALDGRLTVNEHRMIHGHAIRELVEGCDADLIVLLEDDAYVREAGALQSDCDGIRRGETDVYATPRGGMDPEIEQAARAAFADHDLLSPEGNSGPGLWPCFVFCRRHDLVERTSMLLESWTWRPGERVPGIGYRIPDGKQMTTDTFAIAAFELRAAGLRITPVPQFKELWNKNLWPSGCPWFHVGGLSNGDFLSPSWDGGQAREGIAGSAEGLDWAHRIWWWKRAIDTAGGLLPDRQAGYRARLGRLIAYTGVENHVHAWTDTLEPWITWEDTP